MRRPDAIVERAIDPPRLVELLDLAGRSVGIAALLAERRLGDVLISGRIRRPGGRPTWFAARAIRPITGQAGAPVVLRFP